MPLALDISVPDAEASCAEPPLSLAALPGLGRLILQAERVNAHDHVLVLGGDALSLALLLWRSGFTNVGCAPRNLDCVAHGVADALIVSDAPAGAGIDLLLARVRFALREDGWLFASFPTARHVEVPRLYGRLTAAGFVADELASDGRGGLWLAARRRPHLRVVPGRSVGRPTMAGGATAAH